MTDATYPQELATEADVEAILETILADATLDDAQYPLPLRTVETFAGAGLVTHDRGLVLRTEDGREYQITIKRSR